MKSGVLEVARVTGKTAAMAEFSGRLAAGDYAGANGAMEGLWRETRSDFHKALCKVALAFLQAERGQVAGATKFLAQARDLLEAYRSGQEGVDVPALLAGLEQALAALRGGDGSVPEGTRRAIAAAVSAAEAAGA